MLLLLQCRIFPRQASDLTIIRPDWSMCACVRVGWIYGSWLPLNRWNLICCPKKKRQNRLIMPFLWLALPQDAPSLSVAGSAGPSSLSSSFSLTRRHWSDQRLKERAYGPNLTCIRLLWPSGLSNKNLFNQKETLSLLTPAVAQSSRVYTVCAWLVCVYWSDLSLHTERAIISPLLSLGADRFWIRAAACYCVCQDPKKGQEKKYNRISELCSRFLPHHSKRCARSRRVHDWHGSNRVDSNCWARLTRADARLSWQIVDCRHCWIGSAES